MHIITANQLKNKGISAISENEEALITVRGHPCYVVMNIDHYHYLRELELAAAVEEAKHDYQQGDYEEETVEQHIKRVNKKKG